MKVFFLAIIWLITGAGLATADTCAVCGEEITGEKVYLLTDKVTNERKLLCPNCIGVPEICYMCGLPVREHLVQLGDGRILCERDSRSVVLEDAQALEICAEVARELGQVLARFTVLPTNTAMKVVDRVVLLARFKVPGNDYHCPNILGFYRPATNNHSLRHEISLLSGLPPNQLRAVCAHEYGHAWLQENLSPQRHEALSKDAEEGFCELLGYLLLESRNDSAGQQLILQNEYTRGQISLFVEAERLFGLKTILDWVGHGSDTRLVAENLYHIKALAPDTVAVDVHTYAGAQPAESRETLRLKGITWTPGRSLALINDRSFAAGESGKINLGASNVTIRCLSIRQDAVRIQIVPSGEQKELSLEPVKR